MEVDNGDDGPLTTTAADSISPPRDARTGPGGGGGDAIVARPPSSPARLNQYQQQETLPLSSDEDTFLSSYLHAQRPEWADHYVNFEALMECVRRMEARLVEIRRQRRQERYVQYNRNHWTRRRNRHRSIGSEREAPEAAASAAAIVPKHKYNRSEGYLPALAAAPMQSAPASMGNASDGASAGNLESATSGDDESSSKHFSPLSYRHKNKSVDFLMNLPATLAGAAGGGNATGRAARVGGRGGRMRSDSSAASVASSTDNKDRDWIETGSEQFEFCSLIDAELEKTALFYLADVGRVADELSEMARSLSSLSSSSSPSLESYSEISSRYKRLGARLADLYLFVGSNLAAIRKALTRHDRIVKPEGKPLCRYYIRTRRKGGTSILQSLWGHEGLGTAYGSWRKGYQNALRCETTYLANGGGSEELNNGVYAAEEEALAKFHNDPCVQSIDRVAARIQDATHRSLQELVVLGSVGNTLALEPSVLADRVDDKDWDMAFYALTRDGLCGHIDIGSLSARLEEGATYFGDELMDESKRAPQGMEYYLPLGLNLFSTFLYMTNYFIAGPTSAVYIETLGGHKALAGLVIGCTPWAAMASTVLFSVWTNSNFKSPLLFSGFCLCIGNLLYGLALHFNSIELVLIGRIGVGLGGPRVINRRYIADVAPMESRTAVSAAFVTLSAAGTAVGPGLSALFQQVDFTVEIPSIGVFRFNGLTSPGFFMFLVWFLFSLIVALTFKEPERVGLSQLKDKALSPMSSRESSFCEKDKNVLIKGGDIDGGADAGGHGQFDENEEADVDEKVPLLQPTGPDGHNNDVAVYASVGTDADKALTPNESADDDCTGEVTASTSDSRSQWLAFCIKNFSLQVWICIVLLFVDKLTMEAIMSSVAIIAGESFHWSVAQIGSLGVLMGALVIPLSICIGAVSRYYEDRYILVRLLSVSLVGILMLIDFPEIFGEHVDYGSRYSVFCVGPFKYVYGCLIAFSGLQCLESVIMSMLSKVVPHSLAKGFCNSGLINTETGTFGRAIGDVVVTLAGLASLDKMLNVLMIPLLCILVVCLSMVHWFYHALAV